MSQSPTKLTFCISTRISLVYLFAIPWPRYFVSFYILLGCGNSEQFLVVFPLYNCVSYDLDIVFLFVQPLDVVTLRKQWIPNNFRLMSVWSLTFYDTPIPHVATVNIPSILVLMLLAIRAISSSYGPVHLPTWVMLRNFRLLTFHNY